MRVLMHCLMNTCALSELSLRAWHFCQIVIFLQGGHGTGKTGSLILTFSRQGKNREFCSDTGENLLIQGKYLDYDY